MSQFVCVCVIITAHGLKGEVKVKSLTAVPKDFKKYGALVTADQRKFEILHCRQAGGYFICMLSNITDRTAAEALRGTELFITRDALPVLSEGAFYLSDIQGKVVEAEGKCLGRISGFQDFGAGVLMELENGTLIPIAFIHAVSDRIKLDLPEGYLSEE